MDKGAGGGEWAVGGGGGGTAILQFIINLAPQNVATNTFEVCGGDLADFRCWRLFCAFLSCRLSSCVSNTPTK